jgi:hypothetical protein
MIQIPNAPVTKAWRMIEAHAQAIRFYRRELLVRRTHWAKAHLQAHRLGQVLEPGSRWEVGYAPEASAHLVEHMRGRDSRIWNWWSRAWRS